MRKCGMNRWLRLRLRLKVTEEEDNWYSKYQYMGNRNPYSAFKERFSLFLLFFSYYQLASQSLFSKKELERKERLRAANAFAKPCGGYISGSIYLWRKLYFTKSSCRISCNINSKNMQNKKNIILKPYVLHSYAIFVWLVASVNKFLLKPKLQKGSYHYCCRQCRSVEGLPHENLSNAEELGYLHIFEELLYLDPRRSPILSWICYMLGLLHIFEALHKLRTYEKP